MDLNFSSLQSFTRSFIREFKISPLKYRKNEYFDCSCLTPPYTSENQPYLLKREKLNPLGLKVKEFTLKESLIGRRLERAEKTRRDEIRKVLSKKKEAYIITNMIAESIFEHTVLLKTLIGSKDENSNYHIEECECWSVMFIGTWESYVRFGRFCLFNINVELGNTFMERIVLSGKQEGEEQKYEFNLYFISSQ